MVNFFIIQTWDNTVYLSNQRKVAKLPLQAPTPNPMNNMCTHCLSVSINRYLCWKVFNIETEAFFLPISESFFSSLVFDNVIFIVSTLRAVIFNGYSDLSSVRFVIFPQMLPVIFSLMGLNLHVASLGPGPRIGVIKWD